MTANKESPKGVTACPNCGAVVVYRGVGRRPVWCSTRCRNDASLKRLGARRAAIEIRVVEVVRQRTGGEPDDASPPASRKNGPDIRQDRHERAPTPSAAQALGVIRNDPEAVGALLAHLERRRSDGTLAASEWLPVRNALRLLVGGLPPNIERPS